MMTKETWYRYDDVHYAPPVDEYGDSRPGIVGEIRIELRKFRVVKHTPKGVKLKQLFGDYIPPDMEERLVLHASYKRYACPTIDEARTSFLARKRRQLRIYKARGHDAKIAIDKM